MTTGLKTVHLIKEEEIVTFYSFICCVCSGKNHVGWNTSKQENVAFTITNRNCIHCGTKLRVLFTEQEEVKKQRGRNKNFKLEPDSDCELNVDFDLPV